MKWKSGRAAHASLRLAALAGMLLASSSVAFDAHDDTKDKKDTPPARPVRPPQPAAAPQARPAQPARQPERPARPMNNEGRRNTAPPAQNNPQQIQNNRRPAYNGQPAVSPRPAPPVQNNYPQGQGNPRPMQNRQPQTSVPPVRDRENIQQGRPQGYRQPSGVNPRPYAESRTFTSPRGHSAEFRGGTVRTLTTNSGMRINHVGPAREVVVRRNDRVIVTNARGHGYVQRDVMVRDQRFIQRTYYSRGVRYAHVYRPYFYRGAVVNVYTPVRYYRPDFYIYAGSPWRAPVYYRWGWANDPWYGNYGGAYFTPYPVYARPSLWLTDFLIAASFQEAYQARMDAGMAPPPNNMMGAAPMGDDVKQMVAQEVERQLAWERAQAQQQSFQNAPPPSSDPPVVADRAAHTLLAYSSLNADAGGHDCAVTEGDVLQFDAAQPLSGPSASVQVLWSKPEDCRTGSVVTVPIEQLQEMQNHMMENLSQGLQDMQAQQGTNGIPQLAPNLVGSSQAAFAAQLPPPDANVAEELRQQAQEADSAVTQVSDEANRAWTQAPEPRAPAMAPQSQAVVQAPPTRTVHIVKNMTMDDVISALGNPASSINDGKKTIFLYNNPSLKITFDKGKVRKVE
jgi:hypothetical protein